MSWRNATRPSRQRLPVVNSPEQRSYQTLTQTANNDIRVGDSVRIDNGVAQRY